MLSKLSRLIASLRYVDKVADTNATGTCVLPRVFMSKNL